MERYLFRSKPKMETLPQSHRPVEENIVYCFLCQRSYRSVCAVLSDLYTDTLRSNEKQNIYIISRVALYKYTRLHEVKECTLVQKIASGHFQHQLLSLCCSHLQAQLAELAQLALAARGLTGLKSMLQNGCFITDASNQQCQNIVNNPRAIMTNISKL